MGIKILAGYLLTINLISAAAMTIDKHRSIKHRWRIRERSLFLLALIGGSLGILAGMYLLRHKTQKAKFVYGIPVILCLQLALFLGLHHYLKSRQASPAGVVRSQLTQVRKPDEDAIHSFISYTAMAAESGPVPQDIGTAKDAVLQFFRAFRFHILSEEINEDTALVRVEITNLNAKALAHDVGLDLTRRRIALIPSQESVLGTDDFFRLLTQALSAHSYPEKTTQADVSLVRRSGAWEIVVDDALEDALVGGFISAMKDPYLLSAEEVLPLYLEAFSELSAEDWLTYLDMEDIFSTYSPAYAAQLDQLYVDKVKEYFDWSIESVDTSGTAATADITITSIDLPYVMEDFRSALMDYAATTDSITSDSVTLSDTSAGLLLDAIHDHARPAQTQVSVTLENDGQGWQLLVDDALTNALLGDLQRALKVLKGEDAAPSS